jgi:GcrA cell cycle regulator
MSANSFSTIPWSDERVERLKTLWAQGLSCSQIAKDLQGVTRNAVIGKVTRLDLEGRARPSAPEVARPRLKKVVAAKPAPRPKPNLPKADAFVLPPITGKPSRPVETIIANVEARVAYVEPVTKDVATRTVLNIRLFGECRWPVGDPLAEGFGLCGAPCSPEGPYCAAHSARAYQPPKQGKPKRSYTELARSLRRYV